MMTARVADLSTFLSMSDRDLGWLVGIIEGEGWIGSSHSSRESLPWPAVRVAMTDRDVVLKLHQKTGLGAFRSVSRSASTKDHYRDQFAWTVAQEAEVQALLVVILPYLGERRSEAAWSVIDLIDKRRELRAQKAATCGNGHDRSTFGYRDAKGASRCRACGAERSRVAYAKLKESKMIGSCA